MSATGCTGVGSTDAASGRWTPVVAGTDAICDGFQVPAAVQEKLGVGCRN